MMDYQRVLLALGQEDVQRSTEAFKAIGYENYVAVHPTYECDEVEFYIPLHDVPAVRTKLIQYLDARQMEWQDYGAQATEFENRLREADMRRLNSAAVVLAEFQQVQLVKNYGLYQRSWDGDGLSFEDVRRLILMWVQRDETEILERQTYARIGIDAAAALIAARIALIRKGTQGN